LTPNPKKTGIKLHFSPLKGVRIINRCKRNAWESPLYSLQRNHLGGPFCVFLNYLWWTRSFQRNHLLGSCSWAICAFCIFLNHPWLTGSVLQRNHCPSPQWDPLGCPMNQTFELSSSGIKQSLMSRNVQQKEGSRHM